MTKCYINRMPLFVICLVVTCKMTNQQIIFHDHLNAFESVEFPYFFHISGWFLPWHQPCLLVASGKTGAIGSRCWKFALLTWCWALAQGAPKLGAAGFFWRRSDVEGMDDTGFETMCTGGMYLMAWYGYSCEMLCISWDYDWDMISHLASSCGASLSHGGTQNRPSHGQGSGALATWRSAFEWTPPAWLKSGVFRRKRWAIKRFGYICTLWKFNMRRTIIIAQSSNWSKGAIGFISQRVFQSVCHGQKRDPTHEWPQPPKFGW